MTREERQARHLELRERMLAGDAKARVELAQEGMPLLIHLFMQRHKLSVKCGVEYEDVTSEAFLLCHHAVVSWDPEKGTLGTFLAFYRHPLAARIMRQSGPVSMKGRDYFERRKVTALRESGFQRGSEEDGTSMFDTVLGHSEQPAPIAHDCRRILNRSRLTKQEKTIVTMRAYGETLSECGRAFGFSKERARQVESGAMRKLRESCHG
jgi:RNA polymerase sigma factor (sigma-70 family)